MTELVKALAVVKDPFTVFAFLLLVLLLAFQTKRVPLLFFGLLRDKLTAERFAEVVKRLTWFGFAAFVLLCSIALVGQVLAYKARSMPVEVGELKTEIASLKLSQDQNQKAVEEYQKGLALIQQKQFDNAINSIKASLDVIPTLSALQTMVYLQRQVGNTVAAKSYSTQAETLQKQRENADQASASNPSAKGAKRSLVFASKRDLPKGGAGFETAIPIAPDLYIVNSGASGYYRITLKQGATLDLRLRTPNKGCPKAWLTIYDKDGGRQRGQGSYCYEASIIDKLTYQAPESGTYYLALSGDDGTLFDIDVQ